jgi:hypothetical protein
MMSFPSSHFMLRDMGLDAWLTTLSSKIRWILEPFTAQAATRSDYWSLRYDANAGTDEARWECLQLVTIPVFLSIIRVKLREKKKDLV